MFIYAMIINEYDKTQRMEAILNINKIEIVVPQGPTCIAMLGDGTRCELDMPMTNFMTLLREKGLSL